MISFIHVADLHLDSPMRNLPDDDKTELVRNASRRALENLIEEADSRRVDFVLIAGDIWDDSWQDVRTCNYFVSQLRRLGETPVLIVLGNHDLQSNMHSQLARVVPANVTIFSDTKPTTKRFKLNGQLIAVHGQSYPSRSVTDNLAKKFPQADAEADYNIGLLHTSLKGHANGHDTYAPCSLADLGEKGYHYWALGHIHQRKIVQKHDSVVVYSGVIQGRNIRETGQHGAYLVKLDEGKVKPPEPLDLAPVIWSLCSVDVDGALTNDQVNNKISEQLGKLVDSATQVDCHAIRVELVGQTSLAGSMYYQSDLRDEVASLAAGISEALYICDVVVNTEMKPPAAIDQQANLGEYLQAAANDVQIQDEIRQYIHKLVAKLPSQVVKLEVDLADQLLEQLPAMATKLVRDQSTKSDEIS